MVSYLFGAANKPLALYSSLISEFFKNITIHPSCKSKYYPATVIAAALSQTDYRPPPIARPPPSPAHHAPAYNAPR